MPPKPSTSAKKSKATSSKHQPTSSSSALPASARTSKARRRSSAATRSTPSSPSRPSSIATTVSRMPSPKHTFDRLPSSDPYDFEKGGAKHTPQLLTDKNMGLARRVVKRVGYGRSFLIAAITLAALYLFLGGGARSVSEVVIVNKPFAGAAEGQEVEYDGGVGGPATKTDEEGMPVAPALDDHRFDDSPSDPTADRPSRPKKKPYPLGTSQKGDSRPKLGGEKAASGDAVEAPCVVPEGKSETQYALMIDAGSTGSRIHVYKFSYCAKAKSGTSEAEDERKIAAGREKIKVAPENDDEDTDGDVGEDSDEEKQERLRRRRLERPRPPVKGGSDLSTTDATHDKVAPSAETAARLPALEGELFFKLQPGLSSYAGRPREAAESLRPLMEEALKGVPKDMHSCTPIAVKATAGLRLLGESESKEILAEVERWLKKEFRFPLVKDGVVMMDGKDEGVYAWVTINYLLNLIGPTTPANATAAVMDLGGASTQIVFEPSFPDPDSSLAPGEHRYELSFSGKAHPLYQHSHLGYGLMQARRSVHNFVAFTYLWQSHTSTSRMPEWDDLNESVEVPSPCLFKGGKKVVELDPPGRRKVKVTFTGTGAGFDACRRLVDVVMAKDALCPVEPCAFGGIYQPRLMETFQGPIYALSYFYDRIAPLGLTSPFKVSDLRKLTDDVCAGPGSDVWHRFKKNKEAQAELGGRPEYCLDLSFMYSLLSLGYELAEEREVVISKKIDDVELGWALGAAIAMLDGDLHCTDPR